VAKAFTPRRVESLAPRVGELVDELLEPALRRGRIELMSELAYPLPLRVICELLGVPPGDEKVLLDNAPALAVGLDPDPMRSPEAVAAADRATEALISYLEDLIGRRRRQPGDDLLSGLLASEEKGERLSEDDLVAIILLLLIAGHETTANLIGNGLAALVRDPEALATLREDVEADRPAVEELLRYDGPTQMAERITLQPVEVGGRTIPAGRVVVLAVGAANHDPQAFEDPERLNLLRSPNPHLGFGGGAHFCIGAPLARLEARIAIPALVRRLPNLHLMSKRAEWRPSFTIRGLRALPLGWSAVGGGAPPRL
jgi:cytochrome P450